MNSPRSIRLFKMQLRNDPDVVLCRNRARMLAEKCGYQRQDQIRIATAVSEIARNAFRYAKGPSVEFLIDASGRLTERKIKNPQMLATIVSDTGPGILNLDEILSGQYRSTTGMGMGIIGAHRLMDHVEVNTSSAGTTVYLGKELPRGKAFTAGEIQKISDSVMSPGQSSPIQQLEEQDQEILFMLKEIGTQEVELAKVNDELSETNRGVVALYDELDTVYRVGHVLASKLELDDLLQAIIDATTEISGADIGVFLYIERGPEGKIRHHTAGALAPSLEDQVALNLSLLFSERAEGQEYLRFDDLHSQDKVSIPLRDDIEIRSLLAIPVVSTTGVLTGAMIFSHRSTAFFTDRSERILASVALQASVGIENARLYKDVQSASAAKDEFLAVLSHELRNPLNPIFARLSLLEEDVRMPDDAREHLRMIRSNLELETRLIDDLLDMTRIAHGKIVLSKAPVDLGTVITSAWHACSTFAAGQTIDIILELDPEPLVVEGDSVRLQQVFWNLINNSVKFSPPGSTVYVRTKAAGTKVNIIVADSGRGIASGMLKKIFLPFEQVGASASHIKSGLGLGLAICQNIIGAHGGTIRAESKGEDRGSQFIVTLELSHETISLSDGHTPLPVRPGKKTQYEVLLVDDNEDTRRAFKVLLERRGHRVSIASSVEEARVLARHTTFELLISDIGLPDGTGHELMRELTGNSNIMGIAMSGYGMKEDLLRSKSAGFSAHLTKPLKIAELDTVIAELMSNNPNNSPGLRDPDKMFKSSMVSAQDDA